MAMEGALARWSRRKAAARIADQEMERSGVESGALPATAQETPGPDQAAVDSQPSPLELPNPDDLTLNSDFSAFLREGVDPLLRRAALRKLWTLDPVFAHLDGLVEYGEDFTDGAKATSAVQTAYKIVGGIGALATEEPAVRSDVPAEAANPMMEGQKGESDRPTESTAAADAPPGSAPGTKS